MFLSIMANGAALRAALKTIFSTSTVNYIMLMYVKTQMDGAYITAQINMIVLLLVLFILK